MASEAADNGKSSIDFSNNNIFFRQKELILTDDYRPAIETGLKGFRKGDICFGILGSDSYFSLFNMKYLHRLDQ